MSEANNGRNPTKKRGRPKKAIRVREYMTGVCGSRNKADMISAIDHGLSEELQAELMPLANAGKLSTTILAYVGRFPPERQREMFTLFNRLGARGAKRYVECLTRPPTDAQAAERMVGWATREFPALTFEQLADALRLASHVVRDMRHQQDGAASA